MHDLFANRNGVGDFVWNALEKHGVRTRVWIASAFFTDEEHLRALTDRGCEVRLIVRLGMGTSAPQLEKARANPRVRIKYYCDERFHPKLYLFRGIGAVVGSANFTNAGLTSNVEVAVFLPSDDPRYEELEALFLDYWDQAKDLDDRALVELRRLVQRAGTASREVEEAERDLAATLGGQRGFDNIARDSAGRDSRRTFIVEYRRDFSDFQRAFQVVRRLYEASGRRLAPDLPLRLEVDRFLHRVHDREVQGDNFAERPLLLARDRDALVVAKIAEYHRDRDDLNDTASRHRRLVRVLGSPDAIARASADELCSALECVWAFHDQLRFSRGGLPTLRREFLNKGVERIRATLTHLLYGPTGDHVARLADCSFDSRYRLTGFWKSCLQETLGWLSSDDVPICNGGSVKPLRWLGFDVRQP